MSGQPEWITLRLADIESVKAGEVVVFCRDGQFVAHRVLRVERSAGNANRYDVVTRGDAAEHDDSPVFHSEWLGVVASVRRFGAPRVLRLKPSRPARVVASLIRRSDLARQLLDYLSMIGAREVHTN